MLDLKYVRDNIDEYRVSLKKRGHDFPLDELLELDKRRREFITELQGLRHRRNVASEEIAKMKVEGQDLKPKIEEMRKINELIKRNEVELKKIETNLRQLMLKMPNIVHESVPEGTDETYNVEIRRWGTPRLIEGPDHIDIALSLDLMDLGRAAKVAGSRFYYLKADIVKLNFALLSYGLDFGAKKGFTLLQPPYMLKRRIMEGAVDLSAFEESIYKIEDEDLYLITTSEHALLGYHADEILNGNELPLRYLGVSPCFRKEAGAHGRDTKGIFRVHIFEKVEQFVFCKPEDSWEEHEKLIMNAEEFFQSLGIPYRIVNVCAGELGAPAAKKYDLEVWLPGQRKYREAVSCSNCLDWQARRLAIRYRDKPGEETRFVHTLNSTLVATERAIIAIMENFRTDDGSIEIPEVLRPYMGGQERIKPTNK